MSGSGALSVYRGKRVLVTGDTGFKGSWLALWLVELGAETWGLALPPAVPSFHADARLGERYHHIDGDIRDASAVRAAIERADPEVVFHLAAQALVMEGYRSPVETFETNVIGTAHVLEGLRERGSSCAVVVVTSDKCYAGAAPPNGFSEEHPLGGRDPYSASKAAAEHVAAAYRRSFFESGRALASRIAVATARAGNVIGGGDWAADRIVPDAMRALGAGRPVAVRNPSHVRPWQHVLEPTSAYLALAARLMPEAALAESYAEAWNFGPPARSGAAVSDLVATIVARWGSGEWRHAPSPDAPAESPDLRLDSSKARSRLGWSTRWDLDLSCGRIVEWYRAYFDGARGDRLADVARAQIAEYARLMAG